jgi:hypothetical protein
MNKAELLDMLALHGNQHLHAAEELKKEIADLQAQKSGLAAKYAIPDDLKQTVGGGHATAMMADEARNLDREIAQRQEAIALCEAQAQHNLGVPSSYLLTRDFEAGGVRNRHLPDVDGDLRSACIQNKLCTWGDIDDVRKFNLDGKVTGAVAK